MGGLYRIPENKKGIATPDFRLPPSQNQFSSGNFNCTMSKLSKETDKTAVKFKCVYTGDQIGIIYPSRISVKMPDGNDYATAQTPTHLQTIPIKPPPTRRSHPKPRPSQRDQH